MSCQPIRLAVRREGNRLLHMIHCFFSLCPPLSPLLSCSALCSLSLPLFLPLLARASRASLLPLLKAQQKREKRGEKKQHDMQSVKTMDRREWLTGKDAGRVHGSAQRAQPRHQDTALTQSGCGDSEPGSRATSDDGRGASPVPRRHRRS